MAYETILYDISEHVATITLNRPESLNAFNAQMLLELPAALTEAEEDATVRCIILTGAGKVFTTGADLKGWGRSIQEKEQSAETPSLLVLPNMTEVTRLAQFLFNMNTPIIAALNGPAAGIGVTLPIACDLRTAAASARFSFGFVKLGVTPGLGSSYLLPRLVGWGKARQLFLSGASIDAQEAKAIGLVQEVYPDHQFMAATGELARSIAANPPVGIRFMKRGLNTAMDSSFVRALEFEHWALGTCLNSEDYKEGVRAFLEKRQPVFKGR